MEFRIATFPHNCDNSKVLVFISGVASLKRLKGAVITYQAIVITKLISAEMASALRVFKRRRQTPYQTWFEDNEDEYTCQTSLIEVDLECTLEQPTEKIHFLLGEDETDSRLPTGRLYGSIDKDEQVLLDCFYLGSHSMVGRNITGRGCIDAPAAQIWRQTQETKSVRRKSSLPAEYRPKYVRLVAGKEELKVVDNYSEDTLVKFSYRWISFTGTHPKYSRMFCFIAWESKNKTPYCHAFKCEDEVSAKEAALQLSKVFQRKCREIMVGTPISSNPTPVLRKSMSLQQC